MATEKTFSVAGVSFHNGEWKVRYANSVSRGKVLARNGHTEIVLVDLGQEMRKEDCVDALLNVQFDNDEARACVEEEARKFGFVL